MFKLLYFSSKINMQDSLTLHWIINWMVTEWYLNLQNATMNKKLHFPAWVGVEERNVDFSYQFYLSNTDLSLEDIEIQ